MTLMSNIYAALDELGLTCSLRLYDFVEFFGDVRNSDDELFNVEGSIEAVSDTEIAYSILFYDVVNDVEYDGMIGTLTLSESRDDVVKSLIELLTPDFVVAA